MGDLIDEFCWTIKVDGFLPTHQNSQQTIEPVEVIDMRMGYEYVLQSMDLAARQDGDVSEVEENCLRFELHLDVKGRIAKAPIDELRMQDRPRDPQRAPSLPI